MSRAKVKVELNLRGINELMKSTEIQSALQEAGEAVAKSAGKDYEARTHLADWIAITNVYPNSKEAAKDNYENNTLLKAVSSAGLQMNK